MTGSSSYSWFISSAPLLSVVSGSRICRSGETSSLQVSDAGVKEEPHATLQASIDSTGTTPFIAIIIEDDTILVHLLKLRRS